MAYLLELPTPMCRMYGCKAIATHELHNEWNAVIATYCRRHADQQLAGLKAHEERHGRAGGNDTIRRGSAS